MSSLSMTIASWAGREDLVIEIDDGDEQLGLVTFDPETEEPVIELYPRQEGKDWHFALDDIIAMLTIAREKIIEVAGPEVQKAIQEANAESQLSATR